MPRKSKSLAPVPVSVSSSSLLLNELLPLQPASLSHDELLQQISRSAQQCKAVAAAFVQNPAPDFETLIQLHRALILQLASQGITDPISIKLSDQLTKTVLSCLNAQTSLQLKERALALAETKAADAKKSDQLKALELCLAEARNHPDVLDLFRAAFDALKAKRASPMA